MEGALDDLSTAISINPKVAEFYNGRAIARLQKGDLDGALLIMKVIDLSLRCRLLFWGEVISVCKKAI